MVSNDSAKEPRHALSTEPLEVKEPDTLRSLTEQYAALFEKNIRDFSDRSMGSRLFVSGACLLALTVAIRLIQWALVYGLLTIKASGTNSLPSLDDILFISLLIVSVLMMTAGLLANLYLIWSVQRGQSQAIDAARQSMENKAKLAEIRKAGMSS
jgi:hypothetical protein